MSNRHRSVTYRPSRSDRRASRRRVRRQAQQVLHTATDFDEVVVPELRHDSPLPSGRRRTRADQWKYWKYPFWKRRYSFKENQLQQAETFWSENQPPQVLPQTD